MYPLAPVQWLGSQTLGILRAMAELFAILYGSVAVLAYVKAKGFRHVLSLSITQLYFTGVQALPLVGLAAIALGTSLIMQANEYLPVEYAPSTAAGLLTKDVIPLIVAVILIGRSGTAMCVELAGMRLSGQLDALRSMGVPLEHVIVLPRLLAGVLAALALTVYGLAMAIGLGYAISKAIGSLPFALEALVYATEEKDVIAALVKACLFGGAIALVSIREGYSVEVSTREIPQAATRAVVRSMALVLILHSVISISFQ